MQVDGALVCAQHLPSGCARARTSQSNSPREHFCGTQMRCMKPREDASVEIQGCESAARDVVHDHGCECALRVWPL